MKKLGTVRTINAETGETISEKQGAFTLLPAAPGKCPECAVDHPKEQSHNQQSLFYQMQFHAEHGRYPTWTDAMAHCSEEMKAKWRESLVLAMKQHGVKVPDDLRETKQVRKAP